MVDALIQKQLFSFFVRQNQGGDQVWFIHFAEPFLKLLATERSERAMLEENDIPCQKRRDDHIHRDQERIIPSGDIEDKAQRRMFNAPDKSLLGGERFGRKRLMRD